MRTTYSDAMHAAGETLSDGGNVVDIESAAEPSIVDQLDPSKLSDADIERLQSILAQHAPQTVANVELQEVVEPEPEPCGSSNAEFMSIVDIRDRVGKLKQEIAGRQLTPAEIECLAYAHLYDGLKSYE